MRTLKIFCWGILFLCLALSCSDEGGTIDSSHDPTEDKNFAVFTEIFQNFLDAQATSNTFVDGTSGLTFVDGLPNGDTPLSSLYFNNEHYTFDATDCYYYFEPGPESYEAFSVTNASFLSNGLTLYAVASFINQGIPKTGTYEIEYFCDFFCYSTISVRVYYVYDDEILSYYISYPTTLNVVNNNGKVSVSFDSDFYSGYYPYDVYAHGSGTLSCYH